MKRIMKSITLIGLIAAAATPIFAGSAPATLNITASVSAVCTMTAPTALDFGSYDPVVTNAATAKNETTPGVLSLSCTKGTTYQLGFAASTGTLSNGAGSTLTYNLFSNAGHTTAFATNSVSATTVSKTAVAISVYGQLPSNQDVGTGNYTGTATATVNY
jgi:spore coat protein U-like protein